MNTRKNICFIFFSLFCSIGYSQETNYDESKVPNFELPKVLLSKSGKDVSSVNDWENIRRPEVLKMFSEQMYGTVPETEVSVNFVVRKEINTALSGEATLKEIDMIFSSKNGRHKASLLLFIPNGVKGPVPMFLGLNFYGNHTVNPSLEISLHQSFARNNPNFYIFNNRVDDNSRGVRSSRWPVEYIIRQGYGLGVIYYGDLDPDFDDDFQNGLHPLFYKDGQSRPTEKEWGSIGLWSWGLSRALDYLETDVQVDEEKVIVFGHSRLGKTSLWTGVQDERFAAAISNDSGCGGAALSKREFGETLQVINNAFPHWFNDYFTRYNDQEEDLPFDQHMLISLMAPRPVYIASAQGDEWADPKGEYLSGYYAHPVYELYNIQSYNDPTPPEVNEARMSPGVSYHMRSGNHDVKQYDWVKYIEFADRFVR
ncbi:alpha/beta hydrolase family protein [Membranihabitans maritimus]|uniref:alpha/beta hydrolase family protein n=1 Tax=Membranihabitans maritimus TaxID=2904244 RepID=UPI001F24236E|nr:hypothetical protein [Membranihabitans maritimus]